MPKKSGFTLVELLVVISIIAILSAIGLTMYSVAQKSARIAKRIADLRSIQTALELYYNVNRSYPSAATGWRSQCGGWGTYSPENVIPGLTPQYLVAMPADPAMDIGNSRSCYIYRSENGTGYKVLDHGIAEFTSADYQSQRNL